MLIGKQNGIRKYYIRNNYEITNSISERYKNKKLDWIKNKKNFLKGQRISTSVVHAPLPSLHAFRLLLFALCEGMCFAYSFRVSRYVLLICALAACGEYLCKYASIFIFALKKCAKNLELSKILLRARALAACSAHCQNIVLCIFKY